MVPSPPNSISFMIRFPNCENLMRNNMWNCKVVTEEQNNIVLVREETTQRPLLQVALDYVSGYHLKVNL